MNASQDREPPGTSAGGRFAPQNRTEINLELHEANRFAVEFCSAEAIETERALTEYSASLGSDERAEMLRALVKEAKEQVSTLRLHLDRRARYVSGSFGVNTVQVMAAALDFHRSRIVAEALGRYTNTSLRAIEATELARWRVDTAMPLRA